MIPLSILDLARHAERLGRAPGIDQLTVRALRRDYANAEEFPQDVLELRALLGPIEEGQRIVAVPSANLNVPLFFYQ